MSPGAQSVSSDSSTFGFMAKSAFNPPPGWPSPPSKGWTPPPGWQPDPSWPEAPPGWNFTKRVGPPTWLTVVGGVAVLLVVLALRLAPIIAEGEADHFPVPGNCAKVDETKDMYLIRVPCTRGDAQLRVTSRHDNTSDVEVACSADAAAQTGYAFTEQTNNGDVDLVLCVTPK